MKIQLTSNQKVESVELRRDIEKIQDAINGQQTLLEVDAHASDPSFSAAQDAAEKVFVWYNSSTGKLKFRYLGANTDLH